MLGTPEEIQLATRYYNAIKLKTIDSKLNTDAMRSIWVAFNGNFDFDMYDLKEMGIDQDLYDEIVLELHY